MPEAFPMDARRQAIRRKAGTRSWAEAEEVKRDLEDQLAERTPERRGARRLEDAIDVFLQDKRVQGLSAGVIGKYTRELSRLREYCERQGVYTVQGAGIDGSPHRPPPSFSFLQ